MNTADTSLLEEEDSLALARLNELAEAKTPIADITEEVRWKSYKLYISKADDQGTFEAYASVFNVIDSDSEVMLAGAFQRSLKNNPHPLILADHDVKSPIGVNVSAVEDQHGLRVVGKLALGNSQARDRYEVMKLIQSVGGKIGVSVGFRVIEKKWLKGSELPGKPKGADQNREYLCFVAVSLLEYSLVSYPANPESWVTAVKSAFDSSQTKEISDGLAEEMSEKADKKLTASVDGNEHAIEDFAYTPDPSKPSTWKFPIFDEKHARLAWDMFKRADLPADDKPKVLAKIKAACKKFGIQIDDGKGTNPLTETKLMSSGDAQSSPDFDSNLAANQRQRVMDKQHSDIQGALYDTLSAIHGTDELTKEQKKAAVTDCYQKYAGHMSNLHHQIIDQSDTAKNDAAMLMTKEDAAKFEEIIKSGAAGKVTAKLFASHKKTVDAVTKHTAAIQGAMADHAEVVKDLFGSDPGDNDATSTTSDEMGAMSDPTPIDAKADNSAAAITENNGPALANNEQAVAGDPGSHSSLDELLAQSKNRLEQITSGRRNPEAGSTS